MLDPDASESFGFLGGIVNISCSALAVPEANFTWLKDGQLIHTGTHLSNSPYDTTDRLLSSTRRVDSIGRSANSQRYSERNRYMDRSNAHDNSQHGDERYTVFTVNHTTYLQVRQFVMTYTCIQVNCLLLHTFGYK